MVLSATQQGCTQTPVQRRLKSSRFAAARPMTTTSTILDTFWPTSGSAELLVNERGWLVPTDAYLQLFLARPELALVPESCDAEVALHERLAQAPRSVVSERELARLADADARDNYRHYLTLRDGLLAAGTLEAWYLHTLRAAPINVPPVFLDWVVQGILCKVLDGMPQDATGARIARAAELLFRPQRITVQDGHVLSGDQAVLDMMQETGGLGELGRLLKQSDMAVRAVDLQVLRDDNAPRYWQTMHRHHFVLDLTHEVSNTLSHGLKLTMTRADSGLSALARVLEGWVVHFLGLRVSIKPEPSVDDAQWRWHVGLDVTSTALLNDLYLGQSVDPSRMKQLLSLFRLTFDDPHDMRADVAGKPVYLGLAMTADQVVKLKPQNLLLNLPLRSAS
jgi:Family of unknown function (DUF6352)